MNGRVALIYPYFRTAAPVQQLFPPLGIATLAGQMMSLGLAVDQYDCTFRTLEDVVDDVTEKGAAIVGIYVMITLSRPAFDLLDRIKEALPDALTVTGGPLPTLYPERFAKRFDLVFRGEADLSFPSFCRDRLASPGPGVEGGLELSKYPGLYRARNGDVLQVPPPHLTSEEIDALPIPDRNGVDQRAYQDFWMKRIGGRMATLMTTRGCPHDCDFCSKPIFGDRFRKRSVERIMEEVRDLVRLGYDHIWVGDDSFTLDLDHVRSFCGAMTTSGLGLRWTCLSRVDAIDERTAIMMAEAGCFKVYMGLESGSDATLKLMNKRATVAEGARAVRLFHDAGIEVGAFFMVGYPGESIESVESTFALALSLPLDEISFNVPYPLPGSALYSRVEILSREDDWEVENDVRFLFRSDFDEKWLKRRISETMAEFARTRGGIPNGASDLRSTVIGK
ncbi:MAG: B12-binding domain-containing radical SAM protein [Methanomassiliicoccus sp.]|nr:B12-binding domain-containing radical SAM protein [Methanomassiliicoccus sp.]